MTRSGEISRDVASPDEVNGGPPPAPPADDDAGHAVQPGRAAIARPARIGRTGRPVTILFLSGHVRDHGLLALDEEYRAIEQRIRAARHRDAFQLIPKLAVRRSDLQDALLEHAPDIVHFACHGNRDAELLLPGDGLLAEPLPAEALQAVFRVLRDNVSLVVLNACFAAEQAARIQSSIGLAIGMAARVADRDAVAFASALYGALAHGRSVQDAFDLGVAALDGHDRELPRLLAERGVDPRAVRFADCRRPRRWLAAAVAVLAVAAVAAGALGWPRPAGSPSTPPPPSPGMARIAGAEIHRAPGRLDCAAKIAPEDCGSAEVAAASGPLRVEAFEIDAHEVSNAELAAWLNATGDWNPDAAGVARMRRSDGSALPIVWASPDCFGALAVEDGRVVVAPDRAHWPATCVTWYGASEYCRAQHKRLPTGAEWQLAAAGSAGRPFPWGDREPEPDVVSFGMRDGAAAHPRDVASSALDVSPDGVHDLGGSVAEWADDGADGAYRAIHGGSWASREVDHLRSTSCKCIFPGQYGKDVGFRCARSVVEPRPPGTGP